MDDMGCQGTMALLSVFTRDDQILASDNMDTTNLTQVLDISSSDIDEGVFRTHRGAEGDTPEDGSDSDSTNEGSCLGAMTADGQDHYLRLGDTPRRRSALRLSRIIARQQLLRKLSQGTRL